MKTRTVLFVLLGVALMLLLGPVTSQADLGGSNVTFVPGDGGITCFVPNKAGQVINLQLQSITSDGEDTSNLFLKFPADWNVGNPAVVSRSCTNGGTFTFPYFTGLGGNQYDLDDGRTQNAPDNCTAIYSFVVWAGATTTTDAPISWSWYVGESIRTATPPHRPSSSDGFCGPVPGCDVTLLPPATVPVCPHVTLDIQPETLPPAKVGEYYYQQLTASGAPGPYWWSRSPWSLPGTWTLYNNTGGLEGSNLTTAGTYTFTAYVKGSGWSDGSRLYALTIHPQLTFSPETLPAAQKGEYYESTISVSGGTAPYTVTLAADSGPLPAGVTLSSAGVLSGTPTEVGRFDLKIEAVDANGAPGQTTHTLFVKTDAAFTFTSSPNPSKVGQEMAFILNAAGVSPELLPVGMVTFSMPGGETCGPVSVNASGLPGAGVCDATFFAAGVYPIQAIYTDTSGLYNNATLDLPNGHEVYAGSYLKRVNSGGDAYTDTAGRVWAADRLFTPGSWGFTGGSKVTTTNAIDNTADDTLYQSDRTWAAAARPGYRFTVPNGGYEVTLKFAETLKTAAGQRKFTVRIEGVQVVTRYDIFNIAGAPNKAVADRTFVVNVSDGVLDIEFLKVLDNPKINAIQVKQLTTYELLVNAGGSLYTDSASKNWRSDKVYGPGGWGYTGGFVRTTTAAIAGTLNDTLYQSERQWSGSAAPGYRFSVPNGTYDVTFKFAETAYNEAGKRVFGVNLEGVKALADFDIFAVAGGKNIAAPDQTFSVDVTDGVLNVDFIQGVGAPKVNAIRIKRTGDMPL